jgi:hypothetical protein
MRSIGRIFGRIARFFSEVNRALREINEKGMGPK